MIQISDIPLLVFPQELNSLDFGATASAESTNAVTIKVDGISVFTADLYGNSAGRVVLEDMADFFRDYVTAPATIEFFLKDVKLASTTALPCSWDIGTPAVSFVADHFLSLLGEETEVPAKGKVYLPFWADGASSVVVELSVVKARVNDKRNVELVVSHELEELAVEGPGLISYVLDPAAYAPAISEEKLCSVTVKVGNRRRCLRVLSKSHVKTFEFINAFGCQESIWFDMLTVNDEVSFQQVKVSGRLRNILPVAKSKYEAIRNFVPDNDKNLYRDLSCSTEVYALPDMLPLLVKNCSIKDDASPYLTTTVKVSFDIGDKHHRFVPPVHVRTFDATFDQTFD